MPKSPKPVTVRKLATLLKQIRLERRWSYRELGEHVGLPEPTIRKFIQQAGERGFHDTTVHPIRKFLTEEGLSVSA